MNKSNTQNPFLKDRGTCPTTDAGDTCPDYKAAPAPAHNGSALDMLHGFTGDGTCAHCRHFRISYSWIGYCVRDNKS